jgi:DNA-binding MarR family transcriptional regulator
MLTNSMPHKPTKHVGPMTMLQIASLMTMDRATIGHNVRPLERDGLVATKVSEKDRRALGQ